MTPDRRRRFRIFAIVIALSFIAAGALSVYRDHHKHYVNSIGGAVPVLVARDVIAKNTSGNAIASSHLVKPVQVPQNKIEHDAITNTAEIAGEVTLVQIPRGAQLTTADFGNASG